MSLIKLNFNLSVDNSNMYNSSDKNRTINLDNFEDVDI